MPVFVYLPNYIISVKITVSDMHIMELLVYIFRIGTLKTLSLCSLI